MLIEPIISFILIILTYCITVYFVSKTKNEIEHGKRITNMLLSSMTGLSAGLIVQLFTNLIIASLITTIIVAILTYALQKKFYNIMTPATLAATLIVAVPEVQGFSFVTTLLFALSNYTETKERKKLLEIASVSVLLLVFIITIIIF